MNRIFLTLIIVVIGLGIFSCDAPHSNPLDPSNPDFAYGVIDGFLLTQNRTPIGGVKIIWKNQNVISYTNTNGYYVIADILRDDGWVLFEKTGYKKDSILVNWNNQKSIRLEEKLLGYTIGSLDGFVFTPPRNAISGVKVIWKNENKFSLTNENGYYKMDDIQMHDGMLYFEKDGLKKDSQYVQWGAQNNLRVTDKILNYNVGQITGSVKTFSLPRTGINNVRVYWKNQNLLVYTDTDGNYLLNNVNYQNGWLYFEKDGYRSDSIFVQFGNQNVTILNDIFLNSIPRLENINISTTVIHRYTETRYRLFVQAKIIDLEGDVNLVRVRCDALGFNQQLVYNPSTGFYENNFDFGQTNISAGLGKDFIVTARDNNNYTYTIGTARLTRVIDKEVVPKEPINSSVVGSSPTMVWERFSPGYNFNYRVEIYTATIPSELFWSKSNISSDDVRLVPDVTLPAGDYYWVIWCVDEFNNQSRSKEASFIVK
jgi:hypothetical protein